MSRIVYVNGNYVPENEATVSVFDRGFVMADAIYEVTAVMDGKMIEFDGHMARMQRSLDELDIAYKVNYDDMLAIHREMITRNNLVSGGIYIQITRGNPGDRDFLFEDGDAITPTIVLFTQEKPDPRNNTNMESGWHVMTMDDLRWHRRDIKTVQLLWPSLAKTAAIRSGFDDTWMVENGTITEGTSNNAYIIKDGVIITRQLSHDILHGITRASLLRYAKDRQMTIEERPFTVDEVKAADEAFVTSASTYVTPIISIDGVNIGNGAPGKHALELRQVYIEESLKAAI
ncbi:D-amino-acid transaminase [Alphaproteobacteria bacterium]|jgi:D-alanine transaminase|nr:D-amino-acid transaminase [Alphaproteobacteria bacterium]MDG2467414.1 D-amino-acid transaminase [Alphaproteobacteria bacterium]